ncbi:MAG: hypothetical protein JWO07_395 [Candidatus Saccharibacteria bacterium]|nr:hypothetical protein [Candidatus Saccharibacteria bacterium]
MLRTYLLTLKKLISTTPGLFIVGIIVGLIVFTLLFGLAIVNPLNIDWIQNINGDVVQHYIGWMYYRDSAWQFPNIGKIDGLAYPGGISLVYMDVIPIFAIIFKLFSGILPAHFQYFGIFTLLSYLLLGGFAAIIIKRFTKSTLITLLGTVMLVCTPIIIGRSFAHTALTAHWLVLAAIYYAIVFHQEKAPTKKQVITWSILLTLAVLIHAYFIPIVASVFIFSLVQQHVRIKTSLIRFIVPVAVALVMFGLIGGFSTGMATNGDSGLGAYGINLLAPIIPIGYSTFVMTPFTHPQWEGLSYIGLGILLIVPIAWFVLLTGLRKSSLKQYVKDIYRKLQNKRTLVLTLIVLLVFIFSLSPRVFVGDLHIANIPHPSIIGYVWETFRSTGRIFWPIYYSLIILLFVLLINITRKWNFTIAIALILPLTVIQAVDILDSPAVKQKTSSVSLALSKPHVSDQLDSKFIRSYCNKHNVVLVDNSLDSGVKMFTDLSDYIVSCHPALTSGYFARFPKNAILNYANAKRLQLVQGTLTIPDSDLYLTQSPDFMHEINQQEYAFQKFGDYYVITNKL